MQKLPIIPPLTPINLRVLSDGLHLAPTLDNAIYAAIQRHGIPHDNWFPALAEKLPPGGQCVDCGAFIGDHTQQFCEMGFETIGIEPFFDAFVCLCYNSPKSTNILGVVGDGRSVALINELGPDQNHGTRYVRLDEAGQPTIRLDDLGLKRLDFLKLDVEGFELYALDGAADVIRTFKPLMFVESYDLNLGRQGFTPQDLEAKLKTFGCKIERSCDAPSLWDWICTWE
jgi:FkbM family methyltransferase